MYFDKYFSGKDHFEKLMAVITARLSFLYRNSSFLNKKTRLSLCNALIQPHIDYCCSAWFSALNVGFKKKLFTFQRKMARFCLFKNPRDHIGEGELESLSWLTVTKRVDYFKIVHVFRIVNSFSAGYLNGTYELISNVHHHRTRGVSDNRLYIPNNSSNLYADSFFITASQAWNLVPLELRKIGSLNQFKNELHRFLLSS